MTDNQQETTSSPSNSANNYHQDYETCRTDWELLFLSGFITRAKSEISFIKNKDIQEGRYPFHYIKRKESNSLEKLWCVEWDHIAYNVHNIKSESDKLNISSGIQSEWERTENDHLFVKTPSMNVHEAMKFYDLLNESRFSR